GAGAGGLRRGQLGVLEHLLWRPGARAAAERRATEPRSRGQDGPLRRPQPGEHRRAMGARERPGSTRRSSGDAGTPEPGLTRGRPARALVGLDPEAATGAADDAWRLG